MPEAVRQARERIIGGRLVPSKDKILSLYEPEINTIVRGKADAEVEFGNTLWLTEQREGLIIDWKLYKDPVADNAAEPFAQALDRLITVTDNKLEALWTDRRMDSRNNRQSPRETRSVRRDPAEESHSVKREDGRQRVCGRPTKASLR